jgi:hypothetical protein
MNSVNVNSVKCISLYYLLYHTQNIMVANIVSMVDNDEKAIVTSNSSATKKCLSKQADALMIKPTHAIADTGATSVFVLEGTPCKNKRLATNTITILLPDGTKVTWTHIWNMTIPCLPFTLVGHIIP